MRNFFLATIASPTRATLNKERVVPLSGTGPPNITGMAARVSGGWSIVWSQIGKKALLALGFLILSTVFIYAGSSGIIIRLIVCK